MINWHKRYLQQAAWTHQMRLYLVRKLGINPKMKIIEVGVGTGAVLLERPTWEIHTPSRPPNQVSFSVGLDKDFEALSSAKNHIPLSGLVQGDVVNLPICTSSFDLVYCHYLLLWLTTPKQALSEMCRIVKTGGFVAAFAEPDYGARIDYPEPLVVLGNLQRQSLYHQGADPLIGRKLRSLFSQAGLVDIETGLIGACWGGESDSSDQEQEWAVFENDLLGYLPQKELSDLREVDRKARENGERVLFVPTFYAIGRKKIS